MSGKRKRLASFASDLSVPPPSAQTINPHSYPPAKLAQFAVAGLSDADHDPGQEIKDFPHRGLSHKPAEPALESDYETAADSDSEGDDDAEPRTTKPEGAPDAHRRHLALLTRSIHQFLGQGDVTKAARAFGLAMQLHPKSRPVDIRHDNLWALGAEIIMREGEEQRNEMWRSHQSSDNNEDEDEETRARDGFQIPMRWGSAANMNKLRVYLETLIQQYPYDHRAPKKISSLHFNISLYSCEIYNIYSEHAANLSGAGADADHSLVDASLVDEDAELRLETLVEDESFHAPRPRRTETASNHMDKIRMQTLATIKAVATRMDALMREPPYVKNHEMLRLRATASLFMADLAVPFDRVAYSLELRDVNEQRRRDIEAARRLLQTILGGGGALDEASLALALADSDDIDESLPIASQIYSALPIRKA
ncbi:hypothetical protein LMH87_006996 [Akanthomyces muscarius]|uniref:Uncharacterized protein n=1 Tax=Akanthomyces muscarius TaxID=2231603 RepID=A0A9W8QS89_AKAMU|nr:hypothetical protein LMH87_006996 [Akanthomyces muscarius]KAJ4165362.1 hypothetical protein LMH87_006996 [Akanthomyces muscarius]